MKILLAAASDVTLYKGGPFINIINIKKSLEKNGLDVRFFDYWNTAKEFAECDLVHLFGSRFSVYNLALNMSYEKVKFVVSPIFYTRHPARVVKLVTKIDKVSRRYLRGFWWDYGFTREICEWADKILPNTSDEAKIISDGMGIDKNKFRVLHNGVEKDFINADPNLFCKKYGLKDFILTVGHMGPDRKNVLRLVKALDQIKHPAVFIGKKVEGGETPQIMEILKKNKNILVLDEMSNDSEELASAYAACDTFVLPSKFETPGIAALEAALTGAKIVITPFGGTKEYFENMVDYVNPYSVKSIREGIERSLNRNKNDQLKEHIYNNFIWEKLASKSLDIYKSVLSGR